MKHLFIQIEATGESRAKLETEVKQDLERLFGEENWLFSVLPDSVFAGITQYLLIGKFVSLSQFNGALWVFSTQSRLQAVLPLQIVVEEDNNHRWAARQAILTWLDTLPKQNGK